MLIRTLTRFSSLSRITRQRLLPRPGRILVRKGQRVGGDEIVAETILDPQWMMIDLASGLGLTPLRALEFATRKIGDVLSKGDMLAQGPAGYAQRCVYSPVNGRVLWLGDGQILLENSEKTFALNAVYPGQVCELISDRGVEIESGGALIQGIWGNGRYNHGPLLILERALKKTLEAGDIHATMMRKVILGGVCGESSVLEKAAAMGIAGLILASMPAKLIQEAARAPFPIILIQGFGSLPWIDSALDILRNSAGNETILNAIGYDPYHYERPEVFIPADRVPITEEGALKAAETWTPYFTPGQRVRILLAPQMGRVGTIHRIALRPQPLENGLSDLTAEIIMENHETAIVPIANLDVLE